MNRRWNVPWLVLLSACVAALVAGEAAAAKPGRAKERPKYVRVSRDPADKPLSMETAIVRFKATEADKELTVDLVGAVHIGEKSYYESLNKEFENYDVVLYELVAPEGTRVPKGGKGGSGHPVAALQNGMKNMLELEHQLEYVDYQKENFVHADMSPEAFSKSMADRGESMWTMIFRMMGQQLAQQNKNPERAVETDLLMSLFDKNRALSLKRLMADQFDDLDGAMSVLEGPDGSTLITERNKAALKVLLREIEAGKKKIAIFYGAGHMPDMEERLVADHGLKRDAERWLQAWDLRSKEQRAAEAKKKSAQPESTEKEAAGSAR